MPLIDHTLFGIVDKVQIAIDRIKQFEPPEGYYLAFSGGKDSIVIYDLAVNAGVKFDAYYSLTTVDPPELVRFIRKQYPSVKWNYPKLTMWQLIVKKRLPPTRIVRYCCQALKHSYSKGRIVLTGVRWAESVKRKSRRAVELCYSTGDRAVNPILEWEDEDVWEYIKSNNMPYCELYDQGYKRLGCIMCPLATKENILKESIRWPKYHEAYKRAIKRSFDVNSKDGKLGKWSSWEELYDWWMQHDNPYDEADPQYELYE